MKASHITRTLEQKKTFRGGKSRVNEAYDLR